MDNKLQENRFKPSSFTPPDNADKIKENNISTFSRS